MTRRLIILLMWCLAGAVPGCRSGSLSFPGRVVGDDQLRQRIKLVLAEAVESDSPQRRCHSLEALADLDDLSVPARIRKALTDPVPAVRFAAAVAAGDIKDHTCRSRLEQLVRDRNISVQLAAGYALERMGDRRFGQWYDAMLFGDEPRLRAQACMLLGKLGESPLPLRRDRQSKLWTVIRHSGQTPAVKLQAAEALACLGDQKVLENLLRYAGSGYADDRMIAIAGLGKLDGSDAYAMLVALLDDPQIEVRLAAVRALAQRVDQADVAHVRRQMKYRDAQGDATATARIRGLAALALGASGLNEDATSLYEAMDDEHAYVRVAGARAAIEFLRRKNSRANQGRTSRENSDF